MNNEMQNNWRQKLTELDSTSAEDSIDKTAAWQTLHARLQLSPRRKTTAWLRVAAIFLFIAGLLFLVTPKKHPLSPVPITKTNAATTEQKTPAAEEIFQPIQTMPLAAQKKYKLPGNPQNRSNVPRLQAYKSPDTVSIQVLPPPILPPPLTATALLTTVPASPKKILPVVHINELGLQEKTNARFASHRQHSFIQLPLLDQPAGATAQQAMPVTGDEFIKTKISLKN